MVDFVVDGGGRRLLQSLRYQDWLHAANEIMISKCISTKLQFLYQLAKCTQLTSDSRSVVVVVVVKKEQSHRNRAVGVALWATRRRRR